MEVRNNEIVIRPVKRPRHNWEQAGQSNDLVTIGSKHLKLWLKKVMIH